MLVVGGWGERIIRIPPHYCVTPLHALQSPSSAWTTLQYSNNIQPIPPLSKRPYTNAFLTTSTHWKRGNRTTWQPLWVAPSIYPPRASTQLEHTQPTIHLNPAYTTSINRNGPTVTPSPAPPSSNTGGKLQHLRTPQGPADPE